MHKQLPAIRVDQLLEGFLIACACQGEVGGFVWIYGHSKFSLFLMMQGRQVIFPSIYYSSESNFALSKPVAHCF
jgi:hypothetical protein